MPETLRMLAGLIVSYVAGSLPTAYLLVKWTKGVDVRTIGSGNVGATNAGRAAGRGVGIAVLAIDMLKGALAAALIPRWFAPGSSAVFSLLCGVVAVCGHTWSCFLRFQGGKGVATTIGALLGYAPAVAGGVVGVWLAVFALSRYVSVSSMLAAVMLPVLQLAVHRDTPEVLLGAFLALVIVVRHRSNLRRLMQGVEHRAGGKPKHG
ncbi:MAG: glycerol-3-phosphate 1-O-acyltransferase PlsY [Candidatus Omnitrophica bacterium]|nr:glycerol-3-phosphate 1-O-acyltransferase PlsY [Candidatus Omnitrophota bacterium]